MSTSNATRLLPLPPAFAATRDALHRVAEQVVSPARVAATGNEIALEAAPGGFGTPVFPGGGRVRVEGDELVVEEAGGDLRRAPLRTLRDAAAFAGLPITELDPAPLPVDHEASRVLANLQAFAWEVLTRLKGEASITEDASSVHLWPEHFDVAFEHGSQSEGRRATYGISPGDDQHTEPYLYVAPWANLPSGSGWTATGFRGAELGYAAFQEAADQHAAALTFFRDRRAELLDPTTLT